MFYLLHLILVGSWTSYLALWRCWIGGICDAWVEVWIGGIGALYCTTGFACLY